MEPPPLVRAMVSPRRLDAAPRGAAFGGNVNGQGMAVPDGTAIKTTATVNSAESIFARFRVARC
ncbi:MAG: hypothetical protein KAR83_04930 [Thermodesulfovibrionales bacterium]|nr:hypothetical protein [Thermodesulfovibrionales bacterium]